MNLLRTGLLLAAMTALFLACGWALGGREGAMIAFLIALGTNAFAFWNSDKAVLRMEEQLRTRGYGPRPEAWPYTYEYDHYGW